MPEKGSIGPVSGVVEVKHGPGKPSEFYTILVPAPTGKKDPP
jgi:hypothetical protein